MVTRLISGQRVFRGRCLVFASTPWTYIPGARYLTSCALEESIFFFYPRAPYTTLTMPLTSPSLNMTSSRLLRLHVDRGLRGMGTHGSPPTTVLEVPVKWT
jgi:hypothetical protein